MKHKNETKYTLELEVENNHIYTIPEDSTTSSVNMPSGRPSTSEVASNGVISEVWLTSP